MHIQAKPTLRLYSAECGLYLVGVRGHACLRQVNGGLETRTDYQVTTDAKGHTPSNPHTHTIFYS